MEKRFTLDNGNLLVEVTPDEWERWHRTEDKLDKILALLDPTPVEEEPPVEEGPGDGAPGALLYRTGFEEGSMDRWVTDFQRDWPTGKGARTFVESPVHSGKYALQLSIPGGERAACRQMLKGLPGTKVLPRHAIYECWYYFPENVDVRGTHLNTFQWKRAYTMSNGKETSGECGSVNIGNRSDGAMYWFYNHKVADNGDILDPKINMPLPGEPLVIPLGEWVRLRVELKWATDKTGLVRAWQNDRLLFSYENIRTEIDYTVVSPGSIDEENGNTHQVGVACYSDEAKAVLIVDDLAVYEGG